uniref:Sulfotransfer_1 domain-containing protein n=1 Tax=Trichuris muris TaxID=70415 RepID=A0A5S6QN21_TRIMR
MKSLEEEKGSLLLEARGSTLGRLQWQRGRRINGHVVRQNSSLQQNCPLFAKSAKLRVEIYGVHLHQFRDQMPLSRKHDLVIEKTPRYFITKQAPNRIRRMNPNVKLIVVVRDPVIRALSEYAQIASKRPGLAPFERMAFLDDPPSRINASWHAVDTGLYDKHARRWLKAFPRSNILFVNGERLVSSPAAETRRVERFLALPPQITGDHFDLSGQFPCTRKLPSRRPHCLGSSKGRRHPVVAPEALRALVQFYRHHNERFFRMTGHNFTSWLQ